MSKEEQKERVHYTDMVPGMELDIEVDLPELHSFFCDGPHNTPPLTPLFGWYYTCCGGQSGTQYFNDQLCVPTCKGHQLRYYQGGNYAGPLPVTDEKEIAEREIKFRQALGGWIENFDDRWTGFKKELVDICNKLKEDDLSNPTASLLFDHHHAIRHACWRMWEIHFLGFASLYAWVVLEQMMKERFGLNDEAPEFSAMMAGFPNKVYDMDRDLHQFGQLATDMGLGDLFKETKSELIPAKLQESEKGKEWYKKFMNYLETDEVGGWRMNHFVDFTSTYWLEDTSKPIQSIKAYMTIGRGEYTLDDTQKEVAKSREAAIADLLSKIPSEEKDAWEGLIRLAGKSSIYSEEHALYCEQMVHALMRRGYKAIGKWLAKAGTIEKPEDILMLVPDEIDRVLFAPEKHDRRQKTKRRRAIWEEWHNYPPSLVLTDRADLGEAFMMDLAPAKDVIFGKQGVGDEPTVKPGIEADIWGLSSCPGVVEGTARVVLSFEDLKNVQPGDIMVCVASYPNWTPVYGQLKGVIAATGGTLCHAAIISREYGLPTITRAAESIEKIKSGQRIRLDATNGAVFLLDK